MKRERPTDELRDDVASWGRPGGDWQGVRPTFDNPFTWSLPLGRFGGISVRAHVLMLIFIVIMLIRAALPVQSQAMTLPSFAHMVAAMGALVILALTHEMGHALVCRWLGGTFDEALLWPLGGLALGQPPPSWKAHLATACGGPMVNLVVCLIAGGMLGLITGQWMGVAIPDPLDLNRAMLPPGPLTNFPITVLYLVNATSFVMLVVNLVPMFPLDGARILQAAAWARMGYSQAMHGAVRIGYVAAVLLGAGGAVVGQWMMVALAIFGAMTCYITQKQVQWTDSMLELEHDAAALGVDDESDLAGPDDLGGGAAEADASPAEAEAQEVDRILQKIAAQGMDSLTRPERKLLERATQRKREQG